MGTNFSGTKTYKKGEARQRNCKVMNFMKIRGITTARTQNKTLLLYGEFAQTDRPTFHASNNWNDFKNWLDNRINYTKPSKRANRVIQTNELEPERFTMNTD